MKKLALAGIVTAMALFGVTAFAAKAAPGPVRGTISAVNGSVLKITEMEPAHFPPNQVVVNTAA